MHTTESFILLSCLQLIIKDKGTNGKLSTKARFGYDERLVEYVMTKIAISDIIFLWYI